MQRWALAASLALLYWGSAAAQDQAACPPEQPAPTAAEISEAQNHPRDRGLLWRITRQGRTSYLYGTLHVGRWAWTVPGPQVARALNEADVLALEIDPADPQAQQLPAAFPQVDVTPALQRRLDDALQKACLPAGALQGLPPMMQALLLTVLQARWEGLEPAYAQEQALAAAARARQQPVRSLETVAEQLRALDVGQGAKAQAAIEQALDQLDAPSTRAGLRKLAQSWEEGDLQTLQGYAQWCACADTAEDRAALRRLNDDRNPVLARRIAALHQGGQRVFAAVGALHMIGPRGLPRLLAARGFKVERVPFAQAAPARAQSSNSP